MGEWPHPFCALCGTLILNGGSLDPEPNIWDRSAWSHNAFAIEGPECLGEPIESSSHPDELFTWHEATGHTDYEFGWGHLTLLPSGKTVFPHSAHGNRDLAYVESGHVYLGFHRACASIARQFVRRTKGYPVKSFADIWITLNGRYSKGPGGCGGDYAPQIPVKTKRGTYLWTKEAAYYLGYSHGTEWWDYDPFCVPNLTGRLLENLTSEESQPKPESSKSPEELADEIVSQIVAGEWSSCGPPTTLPQTSWKRILVRIPFLWDIDVEQIDQFPDIPETQQREWNWERLVRGILCGPIPEGRSDCDRVECEKRSHSVWDYSHVKLDLPPGLTNRRRIWQILEDMNPKELGVLDEPDFIVLDDHLDRFISRTVKDGVNVEDPDTTCLDWESPSSIDGDVREDWLAPDGCAATGTGDLVSSW
ncbi:hypothetical protein LB507_010249 [Fusarium sp. FIESC RH6]|nr:hypothetical protein LB507_010249 [Fusarium sp. FIESC RH6]